ncbi:helix-turn-helix domain-containing protein [Polaribacter sp.]
MLHSSLSVKEIAYKLGFKDPTIFFKYFKKNTSFTPESYKKRYKK